MDSLLKLHKPIKYMTHIKKTGMNFQQTLAENVLQKTILLS